MQMSELQAKSNNNLALCPFCGGEAETLTAESMYGGYLFGIMCNDCRSRGDVYDTEAEAIAAWNSRVKPPCGGGYCPLCGAAERTCTIEGSYYDELFDETCTNLSCGHAIWQNESPNYCSECGAKVLRNTPKCSETTTNVVGE